MLHTLHRRHTYFYGEAYMEIAVYAMYDICITYSTYGNNTKANERTLVLSI